MENSEQNGIVQFTYYEGCRNCLKSVGIEHIYSLFNANVSNYLKKTEYEVMTLIEKWYEEDNKICEFCGSSNLEIFDIKIGSYSLYDRERIIEKCKEIDDEYLFEIKIDKFNSVLRWYFDGSHESIDSNFINDCYFKIMEFVYNLPENYFVSKNNGFFIMCFKGHMDYSLNKSKISIERFRCHGFSKDDIFNFLKSVYK